MIWASASLLAVILWCVDAAIFGSFAVVTQSPLMVFVTVLCLFNAGIHFYLWSKIKRD